MLLSEERSDKSTIALLPELSILDDRIERIADINFNVKLSKSMNNYINAKSYNQHIEESIQSN